MTVKELKKQLERFEDDINVELRYYDEDKVIDVLTDDIIIVMDHMSWIDDSVVCLIEGKAMRKGNLKNGKNLAGRYQGST